MFLSQLNLLKHKYFHHHDYQKNGLDAKTLDYIENCGYPKNHTYLICHKNLLPTYKLHSRYKKISKLYPPKLESFLDLSCCRGYFVFSANQHRGCQRVLGIDVDPTNIEVCNVLKKFLKLDSAEFKLLTLENLANDIETFGGAYQTVLLANTYQYLYFGSDGWPGYYDHQKIFYWLSLVCKERLIFSNRVELEDCQNIQQVKNAGEFANQYHSSAILAAALQYFDLVQEHKIGKYPLWLLKKR